MKKKKQKTDEIAVESLDGRLICMLKSYNSCAFKRIAKAKVRARRGEREARG